MPFFFSVFQNIVSLIRTQSEMKDEAKIIYNCKLNFFCYKPIVMSKTVKLYTTRCFPTLFQYQLKWKRLGLSKFASVKNNMNAPKFRVNRDQFESKISKLLKCQIKTLPFTTQLKWIISTIKRYWSISTDLKISGRSENLQKLQMMSSKQ